MFCVNLCKGFLSTPVCKDSNYGDHVGMVSEDSAYGGSLVFTDLRGTFSVNASFEELHPSM